MPATTATFEQFVDRYVDDLLRTAAVITWNDDEAEDLVQECLIRLARRWKRVRAMDAPLAYARRILVNLALDDRRRRTRRHAELATDPAGERLPEPTDLGAEAAFTALTDRAELLDAFSRLSPQQRSVLMMRYFYDLPELQVAEILGCSTGTVKSSASRGLARLRELMAAPYEPIPPTEALEQ